MSDDGSIAWNKPVDVKCKLKSEITQQLSDLINVGITKSKYNTTISIMSYMADKSSHGAGSMSNDQNSIDTPYVFTILGV